MTTFGNDAAAGGEPGARAAGAPRTRAPERAGESLRHDVLVVGAGPAGAATAIAARQHGLSVAVLERAACEPTWERTGDTRDIASPGESIAAAAQFALRELGLWQMFVAQGHRPSYLTQSAWGSDELRERHAIEHKLGPDFHVDREHFDAWLRRQAAAAGAELFGGAAPESVAWDAQRRRFTVACRRTHGAGAGLRFEAPYAIDASGRSAWLARRLGARCHRIDDLVCAGRIYEDARFEPSVLVETAPGGWWYSARLPGERAVALHFLRGNDALRAKRKEHWESLLGEAPHSARRLHPATAVGPVRLCAASPASLTWSSAMPFLPVGDAAAAFDPVSGSGLCFAFRSALEAAHVLHDAHSGRADLFASYQAGVRSVFDAHLRRRLELYREERRFPAAAFWLELQGSA